MNRYTYPEKELWESLSKRPTFEKADLRSVVAEVFERIKENGDSAIQFYTEKFDGANLKSSIVSDNEIDEEINSVEDHLKLAIQNAKENIQKFHESQAEKSVKIETAPGVVCWRESRPIEKVGIYIPGGTAPLFSTVLMLAIPASIAGCKEIILCTPPDKDGKVNPAILYSARLCGVTRVFKIGGSQAIAALSIGTEAVPKVYKIFGPGNQFVTAAKEYATEFGVAIDMPAGPSEVLVIADETAVPEFCAADLLSQAEHGSDSQVIFLCTDESVYNQTINELNRQIKELPRNEFAEKSISNSNFILLKNVDEAVEFSNLYAPEHLILAIKNPENQLDKIVNAGSVFLGNYSCESAGDYASGTNHTLPTNSYARNYSGVSVDSFLKKITFQNLSAQGLQKLGNTIEIMAEAEGLFAHKNAVTLRLKRIAGNEK